MKRFLAITCEALARSIYAAAAGSPNTITISLFKQGLHNRPKSLRQILQSQIDAVPEGAYDAVLLVYGMCGMSTVGLQARHTPLVIPRAHDCITLYLGSRERYQQEFDRHPGTYWYSLDYMERSEPGSGVALGAAGIEATEAEYEKYVAKYGQETADMLIEELRKWSQHYTRAVFIDTGLGDGSEFERVARAKAEQEGWVFERMQGDRRLLNLLISGDWPDTEFLVVPPGHMIQAAYGDDLICAVPAD